MLWKATPSAHAMDSPGMPVTSEAMWGTGKYAGISGTITSSCKSEGDPKGYTISCDTQGNYKTP